MKPREQQPSDDIQFLWDLARAQLAAAKAGTAYIRDEMAFLRATRARWWHQLYGGESDGRESDHN